MSCWAGLACPAAAADAGGVCALAAEPQAVRRPCLVWMSDSEYRFITSIPPDREYRVLEFWQADKQVAEANVERGELHLEVYPKPGVG
jgi:hypothetical protein